MSRYNKLVERVAARLSADPACVDPLNQAIAVLPQPIDIRLNA